MYSVACHWRICLTWICMMHAVVVLLLLTHSQLSAHLHANRFARYHDVHEVAFPLPLSMLVVDSAVWTLLHSLSISQLVAAVMVLLQVASLVRPSHIHCRSVSAPRICNTNHCQRSTPWHGRRHWVIYSTWIGHADEWTFVILNIAILQCNSACCIDKILRFAQSLITVRGGLFCRPTLQAINSQTSI